MEVPVPSDLSGFAPARTIAMMCLVAACVPAVPPETAPASGSGQDASMTAAADRTGPCLADEPRLIHYARWLATDPDPRLDALRRRYELELVDASEVEWVIDAFVCARAGSAYRRVLNLSKPAQAVAVIRVGDRYVVTHRVGGSTARELSSAVVFDESFRELATFRR